VTSANSSLADNHRKSHRPGRTGCLEEIDREKLTATHPTTGRVAEAKGIDKELTCNAPGVCLRTDAEIAKAAIDALSWDVFAPPSGIEVITGRVQSWAEHEEMLRAAWSTAGVTDVETMITVAESTANSPSNLPKTNLSDGAASAARPESS